MIRVGQTIQVVVFGLGEEEFALPVASVREILDHRPAFRVPDAPAWFLGLIDVRGRSVPTVDLRVRLGLAPAEPTLTTRILVVELPDQHGASLAVGLVVDRVSDVSTFAAETVEAPPELGGRWQTGGVEAILHRDGSFVALLDPARLFGAGGADSPKSLRRAA